MWIEASKVKNNEESSVHGEGIKRVEDDQLSQVPKEGHVSKVESNEESSVHGLNSWRLEISVPNEQVQNGDRSRTLMNEPLVIDSRNNLRAVQMEGINLVVDLKPADLRKKDKKSVL
ncbi:hypothetical protein RHSIM_Rhsim12G0049300 [Rhododendron simsii]|uniref:Uncharacterized protein n=1 Tax=Rhododendron simsii TaxID=118357 RepID=A0A834G8N0_RHOSS|nr:hypothetical protein RHSIM_Rhsim12G0049300 [Rhododendron simsii]